jgi:hypothetical protein
MLRAALPPAAIALCAIAGCAIDWTVPDPSPSAGGAGAGGTGAGGHGAVSSSSPSSSSSAGGAPPSCDASGDCSTCVLCTQQGRCLAAVNECQQDPDCSPIYDCAIGCGPPGRAVACIQQCASDHPNGADTFAEIATCVCGACPSDCVDVVDELCP